MGSAYDGSLGCICQAFSPTSFYWSYQKIILRPLWRCVGWTGLGGMRLRRSRATLATRRAVSSTNLNVLLVIERWQRHKSNSRVRRWRFQSRRLFFFCLLGRKEIMHSLRPLAGISNLSNCIEDLINLDNSQLDKLWVILIWCKNEHCSVLGTRFILFTGLMYLHTLHMHRYSFQYFSAHIRL